MLVARGASNREIAQHLVISEETAGHHLEHIYNKIGVSSRAAAVFYAMWKRRIALMSTVPREGRLEDTCRFEAEKFANHQVPATFFVGGESPEVLRRATEIARAALPNNRVVILPGQRHVAMDSAPELFVSEVRRFLLDADLPVGRLHEQAVKA